MVQPNPLYVLLSVVSFFPHDMVLIRGSLGGKRLEFFDQPGSPRLAVSNVLLLAGLGEIFFVRHFIVAHLFELCTGCGGGVGSAKVFLSDDFYGWGHA